MKGTLLFLIIIFLISCNQKKDEDIEIYLLKNRIESYEGVPLRTAIKDSVILKQVLESWGEGVRIDTINDKPIFMGHFQVDKKNLQEKPFVVDSEILGLDFKNSRIYFKKSVAERIYDSLPNWNKRKQFGKQFVLCHNHKIILNGYLIPSFSSYWSNSYQIYFHRLPDENDTITRVGYSFNYGLNFEENNLKKHKHLYEAFKNREIKETLKTEIKN